VYGQFSDTLGGLSIGRRLLLTPEPADPARQRLLAADSPAGSSDFKPNVTVAADGSGDVKTIREALEKVPVKNAALYVVYVKAGTYKEYVTVGEKTIITGNKNFKMNLTTKDTATMEAISNGFFMRDIRVDNTAGPENHQVVALRVQSDQTVFYRCTFDGYQETRGDNGPQILHYKT
jgi:pectinesterase